MKKFLAVTAITCMFAASGIAFALEEYSVTVFLQSNPAATDIPGNESYLVANVGDKIKFTRSYAAMGADELAWDWNWNRIVLDCTPDSSYLECTVIKEGIGDVSITVNATMNDASTRTVTSEIISVHVGEGFPVIEPDYYGHKNQAAISYLYDEGIVEGYPDGTFKPENALSRAELMKILVLGAGYDPSAEGNNNCFPDVKDDWYAKYVCFASQKGWVKGYPDGSFQPGVEVKKVEAVKMLLEIFNVNLMAPTSNPYTDVAVNEWYGQYIFTAKGMGLLEETGSTYEPGAAIKRGQVSENIYRLLMDEQERFDVAAEKAMCDYFYFGGHSIITTPLEEVNPLLTENLKDNGFNLDEEGTFDAITSRHTYMLNDFFANPADVCEN